ncbi:YALIA101S12e03246g1_1 [Yarrowia lipolytica]|nr:Hypothetical protein YALI2_D00217g [Yarrowia lipolytica]SEI36588.1 YALIA101S12e03246g1_1 [Yarrowia lipolytica]
MAISVSESTSSAQTPAPAPAQTARQASPAQAAGSNSSGSSQTASAPSSRSRQRRRRPNRNGGQQNRRNQNHNSQNNNQETGSETPATSDQPSDQTQTQGLSQGQNQNRSQRVTQADPSRRVARPKPNQENQRMNEINQVKRRWKSITEQVPEDAARDAGATTLTFDMAPSDPDFPFEISFLKVKMVVPKNYPKDVPSIEVQNKDIPKGFALNVDAGFYSIAKENLGRTSLLRIMYQLDNRLEEFLKMDKAKTIKIVKYAQKKPSPEPAAPKLKAFNPSASAFVPAAKSAAPAAPAAQIFVPPKVAAEQKKQVELLRARIRDLPLHKESASGYYYSLNRLEIYQSFSTPEIFQNKPVLKARLFVPKRFPENRDVRIELLEVPQKIGRVVEQNFARFAKYTTEKWTLTALVNYFVTKFTKLCDDIDDVKETHVVKDKGKEKELVEPETDGASMATEGGEVSEVTEGVEKVSLDENKDENKKKEEETDTEGVAEDTTEEDTKVTSYTDDVPTLEPRGTEIKLSGIELVNIGVLECSTLNLTVNCTRCKTANDIQGIVAGPYGRDGKAVGVSCSQCNQTLVVAFRKNLIHSFNHCAGYLDLEGCVPFDMMPSLFIPTCMNCSESFPQPLKGLQSGFSATVNCRVCHIRMTVRIPQCTFEVIDDYAIPADRLKKVHVRKRAKENLGIKIGEPLPNEGTCRHYKKSHRWLRFSCCGKVFPCDKCHDDVSMHVAEHANRMLCGACSREQTITKECDSCGYSYVPRHSAHWEGGKGMRDQTRMSKKDSRKYKRL